MSSILYTTAETMKSWQFRFMGPFTGSSGSTRTSLCMCQTLQMHSPVVSLCSVCGRAFRSRSRNSHSEDFFSYRTSHVTRTDPTVSSRSMQYIVNPCLQLELNLGNSIFASDFTDIQVWKYKAKSDRYEKKTHMLGMSEIYSLQYCKNYRELAVPIH